jgi:hypothetical protein
MSLFSMFSRVAPRHVSDEAFRRNLANQVASAPEILKQLRKLGVTDQSLLKLEFFFYTNSPAKASALADVLGARGYSVRHGASAHDKALQVVTGWTQRMAMSDAGVANWAKEMCEIGNSGDCEFDGWGTNPKQ